MKYLVDTHLLIWRFCDSRARRDVCEHAALFKASFRIVLDFQAGGFAITSCD